MTLQVWNENCISPVISVVWHDTLLGPSLCICCLNLYHMNMAHLSSFLVSFPSLSFSESVSVDPSCPCLSVGSRAAFMQTDRMQTTILIFHLYNFKSFLKNYIKTVWKNSTHWHHWIWLFTACDIPSFFIHQELQKGDFRINHYHIYFADRKHADFSLFISLWFLE